MKTADSGQELWQQLLTFPDTDAGNAEAFALLYGNRFRYDHTSGHWLVWNGRYWAADQVKEADSAALQTVRARRYAAIQILDSKEASRRLIWAFQSESVKLRTNLLKTAQAMKPISSETKDFDNDPFLLTVANGTLDLRKGELREADPGDLITRATEVAYSLDATCPRWERFLLEIFSDDRELVDFIQRAVGYSLTGETREQCLFILYGEGANGKSTFVETIMELLGTHAATARFSTFMVQSYSGGGRNDIARLAGARFVKASEAEQEGRFDEATLKEITGGDRITARFLFKEYFEFKPQFKLWLATNHKPAIRGNDHAIWRRIRLIPFTKQFAGPERDPHLPEKLRRELPGILRWALVGCLNWQRQYLGIPRLVGEATRDYRQQSDQIGRFLHERCVMDPALMVAAQELYAAYATWCTTKGEKVQANNVFANSISSRKIEKIRRSSGNLYVGVGLVSTVAADEEAGV